MLSLHLLASRKLEKTTGSSNENADVGGNVARVVGVRVERDDKVTVAGVDTTVDAGITTGVIEGIPGANIQPTVTAEQHSKIAFICLMCTIL